MENAIRSFVLEFWLEKAQSCLATRSGLWSIWNQSYFDVWASDDHPAFKTRQRRVPHLPEFNIYSDNVEDRHIETAVKSILKKLLNPNAG